jgi:hypothetical protein
MIYSNCLVKSSLVNSSRRDGRFFFDTSPDVYSSVALSLNSRQAVYCDVPAFWVGSSPTSNGLSVWKAGRPDVSPPSVDQKDRADRFSLECERDGYRVGPSIRNFGLSELTAGLLLLSAIENLERRPWWLRGSWVRSICLQRHWNDLRDSGAQVPLLMGRRIFDLPPRLALGLARFVRRLGASLRARFAPNRNVETFSIVRRYDDGGGEFLFPRDLNNHLRQTGLIELRLSFD